MKIFPFLISLSSAAMAVAATAPQKPSVAGYPSIQEAICANPGRMIYVPAGDYDISTKIHIGRQGGGLFGPGRIRQNNPGHPILVV